jgi:PAS domain S-box-containing protein
LIGNLKSFTTFVRGLSRLFPMAALRTKPEYFSAFLAGGSEPAFTPPATHKSEEKYRLFFENSRDALMTIAPPSWRFTSANTATLQLFGATSTAQFCELGPWDISPEQQPDGRPSKEKSREMIAQALRAGSHSFEWTHRRLNGDTFPADVLFTRMNFEGQVSLQATVRDITERRQYEKRLTLFRTLLDSASDAIEVVDPVTLRFIDVNDSGCKALGYERDELMSMRVPDIVAAPFSEEDHRRHDEQMRQSGRARFETVHRRKDASTFPVEISSMLVELDKSYLVAIVRDITERKRAEQVLAQSEQRFRSLVEQSVAGIYIVQHGRLAYVNPRFANIFGYESAEELTGTEPLLLVAEQDRAMVAERIRSRLCGESESVSYTFTAVRKDGSQIEVGVHGTLASHGGRPAIIGLIQDVSEKKRADEQIQRHVKEIEGAFMSTIEVATSLVDLRDPYTAGHEKRVGQIAAAIGAEMALDEHVIEGLKIAGYIHDIGKIIVPAEILSKPGKLSAAEFELIKGHSKAGYDILKSVNFPWPLGDVAYQHHERLDGSGYPRGLKSDEILLEARITAVADVIEAISSHRPYRPSIGLEGALREIERGRGTAYDAQVVDACLRLFRERNFALPV